MRCAKWVAVALLWPSSLLAEGDTLSKDEAFKLSKEFSRCAGVYDAVAEFARPFDSNMAEHYHGLANGAAVASAMVATAAIEATKAWELAKNLRGAETPYWKSIVTNDGISAQVQNQLNRCMELNPMQAELVDEARRQRYGFSE